ARLINNGLDAVERRHAEPRDTGTSPPTVRVAVTALGSSVVFTIDDQGPGMNDEILSKAIQPFFTTKDPGEGLGLGLFLVHTFAMSASGQLTLKQGDAGGLRAELSLPRAMPRPSERS